MANFDWKATKNQLSEIKEPVQKSVGISVALNVGILGASSVGQIGVPLFTPVLTC